MKILDLINNNWIAILALVISIYTLYLTHFESFSLLVYDAGRFTLSVNPNNSSQIAISPQLIFSNVGAKDGVIKNLAIIMTTPENKKLLLIPFLIIPETNINSTKESRPLSAMPFSGFSLSAKETVSKKIMFIPQFSQPFVAKHGGYLIEVFVKSSKSKKFEITNKMAVQINTNDIELVFKNIPKIKPGEKEYVENAFLQDKTTLDSELEYQSLNSYLNE